jgi:NADH-quinone oxidoreductase subunit J
MTVDLILFLILSLIAIATAVGMLLSRNAIYSALFLVLNFITVAVFYLLLGAPFIAMAQITVYAGAIMVLFLFVIMLLNLGHDYHGDVRRGAWIMAGFVTTGLIGFALSRVLGGAAATESAASAIDASVRELGAVGAIAQPLFRDFLVPFELTSILLLVAIIGAVVLAKRRI